MTDSRADRWVAIVSDPDAGSTKALDGQLRQLGFEVVVVPRAEDVADTLRRHGRALILAALPDSGGTIIERCQEWRSVSQRCYVSLLHDGYDAARIAQSFESGADDVMVKPVVEAEMRTRLTRAVHTLLLEDYRERLNGEAVLLSEISVRSRLHSRRYLHDQLGNEMDRARRFAHALALILVQVVATRADERLLRNFGVFLNGFVRAHVDWVARYTERTFALVLPETQLLGAVRAAHRLRSLVNQSALLSAGLPPELKVSIGVSALDAVSASELTDTRHLMEAAESYLREAVHSGPDRIIAGKPQLAH